VSVVTPPRPADPDERSLDERVAELEALIEEARRRARRRRQRIAVVLIAGAIGATLLIGFGGHSGNATGTRGLAGTRNAPSPTANNEPLGALPPTLGFVQSLAFDPRNPRVVYLVAGRMGVARTAVVKTTDGGAHWRVLAASGWPGGYQTLVADPRHPGTLYAGTGVGVFKTVDGGQTWRRSNRGMFVRRFSDRNIGWVSAIAVDPLNTSVVYAGTDQINKSTDGGHSWRPVFTPEPVRSDDSISVSALAVAPTHPETIYAIHASSRTGDTSIYTSSDAGKTWRVSISVPTFVHGFVTDLVVDPHQPTTVYAAVGATVLKTQDGGRDWQPIGHGLPVKAGLPRGGCHCNNGVTTLAIDPHRPGTVYAGVNQGGIYETTSGGRHWRRVAAKGTYYLTTMVGVDPAQPTTVYGAGLREYDDSVHLFRTTNGGRTWASAPEE